MRRDLKRAGYELIRQEGKGSHTEFEHPLVPGAVTVSGHDGDDAKSYQEQDVKEAIEKAQGSRCWGPGKVRLWNWTNR